MAGINKVILVGNVGRDPELRQVGTSGQQKAAFTLATSRSFRDKNGNKQEQTQWHRCITWGQLAEQVTRYAKKGRQVYVEGSIETREYVQDGARQRITEIQARQVEFLDKPSGDGGGYAPPREGASAGGRGGFSDNYGDADADSVPF